jgi:hypothetical protein
MTSCHFYLLTTVTCELSSMNPRIVDLLKSLRVAPTTESWELLLRRLLKGGEIDSYVREAGNAEEAVRALIENSNDTPASDSAFHQALNNVVQTWQPEDILPKRHLEKLLQLISAFTPLSGFPKILGYLTSWRTFALSQVTSKADDDDLVMRALIALQNYFPVAPIESAKDPAFASYSGFLRELLNNSQFAGHACRRLLELELLPVDAAEIETLVKAQQKEAAVLPQLLEFLLTTRMNLRNSLLAKLYSLSLNAERQSQFLHEIQKFGAELRYDDRSPILVLSSGEEVQLLLKPDDIVLYTMQVAWPEADARGKAVYKEKVMSAGESR